MNESDQKAFREASDKWHTESGGKDLAKYIFEAALAHARSGGAVAWLKTWNSVGGAQKGMKRVDLTPDCETWLSNMFPKIEPLFTHSQPAHEQSGEAVAEATHEFFTCPTKGRCQVFKVPGEFLEQGTKLFAHSQPEQPVQHSDVKPIVITGIRLPDGTPGNRHMFKCPSGENAQVEQPAQATQINEHSIEVLQRVRREIESLTALQNGTVDHIVTSACGTIDRLVHALTLQRAEQIKQSWPQWKQDYEVTKTPATQIKEQLLDVAKFMQMLFECELKAVDEDKVTWLRETIEAAEAARGV